MRLDCRRGQIGRFALWNLCDLCAFVVKKMNPKDTKGPKDAQRRTTSIFMPFVVYHSPIATPSLHCNTKAYTQSLVPETYVHIPS